MPTARDLRQEIWHCLRFWLFDYCFSDSYPYAPAAKYGFTPAVFHALSHWKLWMARKPGLAGIPLEARYKHAPYDDGPKCQVPLPIPPDAGEFKHHDYLLRKPGGAEAEVLCAVESEYGELVEHLTEDLRKRLLAVRSPLKVMVYRMPYPERVPPPTSFAQRKHAIEATLAADPLYSTKDGQPREEWLFVGFPWYRRWPKRKEDAFVRLYTFSTPCEPPPSLSEPEWDIWQPGPDMDQWLRSLYPSAGGQGVVFEARAAAGSRQTKLPQRAGEALPGFRGGREQEVFPGASPPPAQALGSTSNRSCGIVIDMAHSIEFAGHITWNWLREAEAAPRAFGGDITRAWLHPDGSLLIDYQSGDSRGKWKGSVRFERVAGTDNFIGKGQATQAGRAPSEVAIVRCRLARKGDQEWALEEGYWREILDRGTPGENTKEADWTASLAFKNQQEWEDLA